MSNYPRRSARLSSHLQQPNQFHQASNTLPAFAQNYSQSSSTSTSSHPSPIGDGIHPPPPPSTPQQPQMSLQTQSHFITHHQQQSHIHAPLPSPSAMDVEPFFGRQHTQSHAHNPQALQTGYPAQQRQQQYGEQQQQFDQQSQQQHQFPHHQLHPHSNSMSQDHPAHAYQSLPGQLPPDFLAEAAKRAQMACLMRDLGDVSL